MCLNKKSVSFLLGAGFSVPAGYPTASEVGKKIVNTKLSDLYVAPNGTLALNKGSLKQSKFETKDVQCLLDFIEFYNKFCGNENFDYEKFYDFYKLCCTRQECFRNDIFQWDKYFQQFVALCIDDKRKSDFRRYAPFVNNINELSQQCVVNVHSLNHDDLFEHLFIGNFSDGFTTEDSPYNNNIPVFRDKYDSPIRLFKLHGSLDQYTYFYQTRKRDVDYIKCNGKVSLSEVSNRDDNNALCFHLLVPDFLTGSVNKIARYGERHYKILFNHFWKNLSQAKTLVVIGYGGRDKKINEYLLDYSKKAEVFIYDKKPGSDLTQLSKKLNATLIEGNFLDKFSI